MSVLAKAARLAGIAYKQDLRIYGNGGGFRSTREQRIYLPASAYDYVTEAGRLYDNGVVLPLVNWKARRVSEAQIVVQEIGEGGKWTDCPRVGPVASILSAFEHPNEHYGAAALWKGIQLSWDVRGNAYMVKRRDNAGRIIGFWFIPHWQIVPRANRDNAAGTKLVTHYEYTPFSGSRMDLDVSEVVQLRFGIDPMDPASGLSPLAAELRDICADNEVSNWLASLLRNGATPGTILVPKDPTAQPPTPEQRESVKSWWRSFRRDNRGDVGIMPMPLEIVSPGFNPQQMELGKLREIPTARICAALGIDPMCLGLPSESKTYSNLEEAGDGAVKGTIIPDIRDWASQLTTQCLADFGLDPARYRFWFDTSAMSFLQDDTDNLHARIREDFKAGLIDRYAAKERLGEKPDESDRGVYYSPTSDQPAETPKSKPAKAKALTKAANPRYELNAVKRFASLNVRTRRRIAQLAADLADGHLSASEWAHEFDALLADAHGQSWALGRLHAGDTTADAAGDRAAGRRMADLESEYLQGFLSDLLGNDPRYFDEDGQIKVHSVAQRMDLYRAKMRGTANDALVESSADDEEWDWVLGGVEDHCVDCPYFAENSPYTKDTLSTKPGLGGTPCLGNCKCHLVRASDGLEGFKPQ